MSRMRAAAASFVVIGTLAALLEAPRTVAATCVVAPGPQIDVTTCGAWPNDTTDDSVSIQAANDQIRGLGGGRVYFPPGTYLANNLNQDSDVEFFGSDRATTTIKHSAPSTNRPLLRGRRWERASSGLWNTGDIEAGSTTLTMADATHIVPGVLVSIRAAGGGSPTQSTTLSRDASATATTLNVRAIENFASLAWDRYLMVGNEVVSYYSSSTTLLTGPRFTGVNRRLFGTPSTNRPAGTVVSQALRLVAEVVSVTGNTVTLDRPAVVGVKKAAVKIGSTRMTIRGLTLDGNQPSTQTGLDPWPLYYGLARSVTVADAAIVNGENGGMRLDEGTRDAVLERNLFKSNGDGYSSGSAHVWLFRGAKRNVIRDNTMTGPARWGIVVDDRTYRSSEYDAPSGGNTVSNNSITGLGDGGGETTALSVYGSHGNTIEGNYLSGGTIGLFVGSFSQGLNPSASRENVSSRNVFENLTQGIRTNGIDNLFTESIFDAVETPCRPMNSLNTFIANGPSCPDSYAEASGTVAASGEPSEPAPSEPAPGEPEPSEPEPGLVPKLVGGLFG